MARDDRRVTYPIDPATTALVSVDFQVGFGRDSWVPVPHAEAAVRNFIVAAHAWREVGGTVIHVHTAYTPDCLSTGRMTDFAPDVAAALAKGSPAAAFYEGVVQDGDFLVRKTTFGAVISSDILAQLQSRHFDTAVVGGLTTPICVQTTVDGLSMTSLFPDDMQKALVYRYELNFHHQLKARLIGPKAVVQIVRESSLTFKSNDERESRRLQDPATLSWNLCTTAFFKAGGRPWKLAEVRTGVCYVGLVFKKNTIDPASGNACCGAQMFLDSGDGLVFKGAMGPWYSSDTKEFHLSAQEAKRLMETVVKSYKELHGGPPKELFIHGKVRFDDREWEGFQAGAPAETNLVGVRIIRSQDMKLFRMGSTPVLRGTAYRLSRRRALLWTMGYIPRLQTYPGREVPNPLSVEVCRGEADLDVVLRDIMGLTKVNFNACVFADGLPVTLRFADSVGEILTAAPAVEGPPLPFRHYI